MIKEGYKYAQQYDKHLNQLLGQFPITKENAHDWLDFCRQIKTSVILIEHKAIKELKNETRSL
jgi:hypothetical protein